MQGWSAEWVRSAHVRPEHRGQGYVDGGSIGDDGDQVVVRGAVVEVGGICRVLLVTGAPGRTVLL